VAKQDKPTRKDYSAPHIIHTEKLEARAAVCSKANDSCAAGSIQS